MRKFWMLVLVALATAGLGACSLEEDPVVGDEAEEEPVEEASADTEPDPVETAPPTTESVEDMADALGPEVIEELYLSTVRDLSPALVAVPDNLLIEVAESICTVLETGGTIEEVSALAVTSGLDANAAGTILGAGVVAYCPEYNDLVTEFTG